MRNILKVSYSILGLLLVVTVTGYLYGPKYGYDWIKDLSLNLGTEILGIFLTVFLIDAVIRSNEERERLRIRKVALQQLRFPLMHQLLVLHGMYKAASLHTPTMLPTHVQELFNEDYFAQIAFLDFSKPAPLASVRTLDWSDYMQMETQKFKTSLSHTLEKYAVFLDGDTLELIEKILSSSLLAFCQFLPSTRELDLKEGITRQYTYFAGTGMAELVRDFTTLFTALVTIFNQDCHIERRINLESTTWRNDVAPQIGSARFSSP